MSIDTVLKTVRQACENGRLDTIKFLFKIAYFNSSDKRKMFEVFNDKMPELIKVIVKTQLTNTEMNLVQNFFQDLFETYDFQYLGLRELIKFLKPSLPMMIHIAYIYRKKNLIDYLLHEYDLDGKELEALISVSKHSAHDLLHIVCNKGHMNAIKYLFGPTNSIYTSEEMKYELTTDYGNSLDFASCGGRLEAVKFFINLGCPANSDYSNGFHFACRMGYLDVAKLLYANGARIDDKNNCFADVCGNGDVEMARWMLTIGSYHSYTGDRDSCPISRALDKGHDEIIELLNENGYGEEVIKVLESPASVYDDEDTYYED